MESAKEKNIISPTDIAKYFIMKAENDGGLITPLKMQKMVYFAYVAYLLENEGKKRLFEEKIEAWPAGPVVPGLYYELKKYGSMPIDAESYVDVTEKEFLSSHPEEVISLLDGVYEACEQFTSFELVAKSHQEKAWLEARKGLAPHEHSNNQLLDENILKQHLSQA